MIYGGVVALKCKGLVGLGGKKALFAAELF